jgi:glycosyltransferase involved in cell wall biosynthesis
MFGVHIVDYTMPKMGYQDFLLPKKLHEYGYKTIIITSDRFTPINNYESTWGKIMGPRIIGSGDYIEDGLLIRRLKPVFEVQRRILLNGLYTQLKELKPKYIFVHNILSMNIPIAVFYANKYKIPLFVDSHLTFTSSRSSLIGKLYYLLVKKYYKKNFKKFSKFYGVAEECREHMEKFIGIDKKSSTLLPIGIDEKIFFFNDVYRKKIRSIHNVLDDEILLIQTGKLSSEKGIQLLPQILKRLNRDILTKIKILLVGDGDSEYLNEHLHKPLRDFSFKSYEIIGFVNYKDLFKYYSAADIVFYPLASSLSALEAASCRCIVFMSNTDASKWRAEKGVGFSINFNDPINSSKIINYYLSLDKVALEKLKYSAEYAVRESFSYKKIVELFIKDLKEFQ